MPLLMCPNDNAPMQTVDRSGVQFDMCPTCRGVWLDRGELEKLMAAAVSDAPPARPAPQQAAPPPSPWGDQRRPDYDRDRRPDHRYDDDYRYKRKKRDSIFDIFD
jgi:Zn-finger nucleic acid-binding protein